MKFLLAYTLSLFLVLGVLGAPTLQQNPVIVIIDEKAQVAKHGQSMVDDLKEAARQSQINVEHSIEVVKNSGNPNNAIILREAFGLHFHTQLGQIQQSLEKIKVGVLKVKDVNAVGLGDLRAAFNYNIKQADFGPLFHVAGHHKAGIILHERSHAFADTRDYFMKKDERGLTQDVMRKEKKQDYWTGYLWSSDWPHIPSNLKARNADSYKKLGILARHLHDLRDATPTPKENPIIKIMNEQDQIKMHGPNAVDNVKKAALQSQFYVEQAIRVASHTEKKENDKILLLVFGKGYKTHLHTIQDMLQKTKESVLIVGGVNEDVNAVDPYLYAKYDSIIGEGFFRKDFHRLGAADFTTRATVMLEQRVVAFADTFEYFSKDTGRGLANLQAAHMPRDTYLSGSLKGDDWQHMTSASRACNVQSLADLGRRAAEQYEKHKGKPPG